MTLPPPPHTHRSGESVKQQNPSESGYSVEAVSNAFISSADSLCPLSDDDNDAMPAIKKSPLWIGIGTNMLYDLAAIPDLAAEVNFSDRWSVGLNAMLAWWNREDGTRYWRIRGFELYGRYYFGRRRMLGHHVGVYGQLLQYDLRLGKTGYLSGEPGNGFAHYPTWAVGGEYGYTLRICRRLQVDFSLGVGYMGGRYHTYTDVDGHNVWLSRRNRRWFGPTRAGVTLMWIIGKEAGK